MVCPLGGRSSFTVTVSPEKIVAVARLPVSISDPAAPVAVETAEPSVAGSEPLITRPAWSPAAPSTHSFCRISVAEVRVLVNVHTRSVGVTGTV